ncbi:hypothetical protein EUX98_g9082 [Antrodiella citrinella]|uniref:Uncharacterized protein n=1 Tax=Antrodiella citrinella TaxID=2447956 RepID=A0A4S4LYC4_9APHY|nr:hypothetical protein EUX98_g9082 [Antrodiella citrinella]
MESGKPKKNSKRRVESPSDHPDPQPSPIDLTRSETPSVSASGPSSNSHTVSGPSALQTGATTPAPTRPKPTPTAKKPRGPPPGVRADHFNAHTLHAQPQQQTKQKEDHITKRVSIIPARKKAVPSSRKRPEDVPPPVASRPSASTSRKRVEDFPPPTPVRTVKKPRLNTPSPETEDRDSSPPPKRAASTRSRNAESKNVPDRSRDQTDSLVQVELASLRTDVASLKENTCVITADHAAVKASQEATSKTQETLSRRVEAVEQSGAAYTQSLERIQAETEAVMETFKKEMKEFRAEQEIVRAQISSLAKITTLETMMDVMRRDVNKLTARHGASEQLIEQLRALYESRISNEASSSSLLDQSPRFVPAVNVEEICSLVSDHMHDTMYAAVKMLVKGFLKETFPESWEPDKWVSGLRHAEDRQRQAQMLVDRMQERQVRYLFSLCPFNIP